MPESSYTKNEGGLRTQGSFKRNLSDQPLVTIITVVFNAEKYLEETILSVLNQTFDNIEYIIMDGGSTDSTIDIINKYNDAIDY
jgi:cellulose synthase/poly-beta-1,6-N-acetylglucosamine synthase-like glycosyltransferase